MSTATSTAKLNTMSILGFVFVFIASPLAVIFGAIALSQINRTGERGRALALWAIALGALKLVFGFVRVILAVTIGWDAGFFTYVW
ncbi:DUF4190 domain-containing protein [Leifsonia sp. 22587]|uniref:DUF4190 domain-containing protein n=1 Tax=Leifsonia sp. 22587 TaxID=3453946 RepID=UPI003F82C5ED